MMNLKILQQMIVTTNFHRCYLHSVWGLLCMFVLSVDEIQDFKGCPLPEYFTEPKPK